jgi:hypothetical protein
MAARWRSNAETNSSRDPSFLATCRSRFSFQMFMLARCCPAVVAGNRTNRTAIRAPRTATRRAREWSYVVRARRRSHTPKECTLTETTFLRSGCSAFCLAFTLALAEGQRKPIQGPLPTTQNGFTSFNIHLMLMG